MTKYNLIKSNSLNAFQEGKALGFLYALNNIQNEQEGSFRSVVNGHIQYLKREIKKLGLNIVVTTDKQQPTTIDDLSIYFNMDRENPFNEGTN